LRGCVWVVKVFGALEKEIMMSKLIPYRTDEDIKQLITQFDEYAFDDLPKELQSTIRSRTITFNRREPTEIEQWETKSDALEHRVLNKELTLEDYINKYKHGKDYNKCLT